MAPRARTFACVAAAIALAATTWLAPGRPGIAAETYPQRTVQIIVPFAPGGTADLMPRIVGDWLSPRWGQPVVIENRPGAGGNVGAEVVFRAEPDGYTLLSSPPPPLVINQNLYPRLGFDPAAFVPVSAMGLIPNALVVSPRKVAAATVADFIADARDNRARFPRRRKATARLPISRPRCLPCTADVNSFRSKRSCCCCNLSSLSTLNSTP
jgi:tripartite-type tricarboxylate transporter receptor subunit TctC